MKNRMNTRFSRHPQTKSLQQNSSPFSFMTHVIIPLPVISAVVSILGLPVVVLV